MLLVVSDTVGALDQLALIVLPLLKLAETLWLDEKVAETAMLMPFPEAVPDSEKFVLQVLLFAWLAFELTTSLPANV